MSIYLRYSEIKVGTLVKIPPDTGWSQGSVGMVPVISAEVIGLITRIKTRYTDFVEVLLPDGTTHHCSINYLQRVK